MKIMFLIAIAIIIFGVVNYDNMSYKKWYERCKINSKHPRWKPNCRINFLKEDPQWFIDNGYEKYVH